MVKQLPSSVRRRLVDKQAVPIDTAKIRKLRESLGLSQEDAAQNAGLPGRQRWNKIESGKVENITLKTLENIAAALGVKARDLLK